MNYFLESNESQKHIKCKEQLFKILSTCNIKLYNHLLKEIEFDINKGCLQMESFTLCDRSTKTYTFINEPLYNNKNFICKQYIVGNDYNCDLNTQNKITDTLPCFECINKNGLRDEIGIGFTPDISYIENNRHKIWFEINNQHPCSIEKKEFCRNNDIILLEIDAQNFNESTNKIFFNELNYYDFEDSRNKENIASIYNVINSKGYASYYDLKLNNIPHENKVVSEFLNHYGLRYVTQYDKYIADKIGYNKSSNALLIIENEKYESIFNDYTYSIENHFNDLINKLEPIIVDGIKRNTYYKQADAVKFMEDNYYFYNDKLKIIDIICEKNNLVNTQEYDKNKFIIKGRPKLIISKEYI